MSALLRCSLVLALVGCPRAGDSGATDAGRACGVVEARIASCKGRAAALSWRASMPVQVCEYVEARCREATDCATFNECIDGMAD
ncbi:MAG: hypothetical protein SFW67_23580 [Myxococcaceae bacterium]|nr:hypothetical protein [Myxococcaceae bacterium]